MQRTTLNLIVFLLFITSVQFSQSQYSDPRVEVVRSIPVNPLAEKIMYRFFGQVFPRSPAIIRDLFTTKDPSQGVIALLPMTTVNGHKEVLVWIPHLEGKESGSQIQLVELPIDHKQLKKTGDDYSLATPSQSIRYRWSAGGESGYMTAHNGIIYLWTKGASAPVVFERAPQYTRGEGQALSAWDNLRLRIIRDGWFEDSGANRVTLLNAGSSNHAPTGLEAYLGQMDPSKRVSVLVLSTEHDQSADFSEEKKSVSGFKNFAVVIENDPKSGLLSFEKSNLVGVRDDGTFEVFPGIGRVGLKNSGVPASWGTDPYIGFRTGPNQVYYIDQSVFSDIAKDFNTQKSPLFGNKQWSILSGYYYQYVYLITSSNGLTFDPSERWKVTKMKSDKTEAIELVGRSLTQQIRQMPNRFVEMLKEMQIYKKMSCLRLF